MKEIAKRSINALGHRLEKVLLLISQTRRGGNRLLRRLMRKPRTVTEGPNLLPTLIKVLAAFANADGHVLEEEVDSSLGFLRYDYPEAVYSELRMLFRDALHEQQDLNAIAQKLAVQLSDDRKILLGVQLYDLIARAGMKQDQVIAYYSFMSHLGMAAQAIDIVYQLNSDGKTDPGVYQEGASPLESVSFGPKEESDVALQGFSSGERLMAYRYHDLIIFKNLSDQSVMVQGRALQKGDFCRVYPGQRLLVGEYVITHTELVFYFNAKKNVSLSTLFVALNANNEVRLEKSRSRDSCLEVVFGLRVRVKALEDVNAILCGQQLVQGTEVDATFDDRILFHNDSELDLNDLYRRARSFGGRFHLQPSKSEYLVSNNPALLHKDDILLSQGTGGDVLLKIFCDYDNLVGRVKVLQADRPIIVHGMPVRNHAELADGDTIRVDVGQVLRCNFSERLIEEERNIIRSLELRDVTCRFRDGETALEGISFGVQSGEMVCVMGASGAGKSSLLKSISGVFVPAQGEILFNGRSLYAHYDALRKYVAYVPQHDAFDEQLTIEENLEYAASLRSPHLSRRDRNRRVEGKLVELGLNERRGNVVGSVHRKTLSGGERKRLNIGLDMIGMADIYLFDEPTSGLSSKDSEHVIDVIRGMSHNKIVLVTIHQPSSKIFQSFHKAILLDKGGKLVFFGTPTEMLTYFAEAEHQQQFGASAATCAACGTSRPEFIFDVLETPLRDLSGDIIYEENNRGQLVPARRYTPEYWRDKYEAHRLLQDVKSVSVEKDPPPPPLPPSASVMFRQPVRWREEWNQFVALFQRAFFSKLRNRVNVLTTVVEAPVLAFLIGLVLRYSESETYDFASAFHIPTYLFLALVVAMFLGLTNSVDDIIRDRPVLLRERNLKIRLGYYIGAKFIALAIFALVQCVLFIWIGDWLLGMRGMFWIMLAALFLTSLSGIAIGLVISSLVGEGKTAVNIIPIVLIPQIILGGALIKYEEMNQNLDFIYTINQWFSSHSTEAPRSDLQVPFICEFMPMRWSYEGLVYAQARYNPFTWRQHQIQAQINALTKKEVLSSAEESRLDDLKELLALLSGLQAPNAKELDQAIQRVDAVIRGGPYHPETILPERGGVSAEQLYVNQKVSDLVSKAEMEQSDYRESRVINIFFGPEKNYLGIRAGVLVFNTGVLIVSTLGLLFLLYGILWHQLRKQG